MPTHQWLLRVTDQAQAQFDKLPSRNKMAIFNAVRELLEADNPLAVRGVVKVQEREGVWRCRAGDYRSFFAIESTSVVHQKHEYKGTLFLLVIRKRNEDTYKR